MKPDYDIAPTASTIEHQLPHIARVICDNYADGDFAELNPGNLRDLYHLVCPEGVGDSLFFFIVAELIESAPLDGEAAVKCLDQAVLDLLNVRNAIASRCGIHELELAEVDDPLICATRVISRAVQRERLITREEALAALIDLALGTRTPAVNQVLKLIEQRDGEIATTNRVGPETCQS